MKEAVFRIEEREGVNGVVLLKALYGKIKDEDNR
jgi:hypothetical protein